MLFFSGGPLKKSNQARNVWKIIKTFQCVEFKANGHSLNSFWKLSNLFFLWKCIACLHRQLTIYHWMDKDCFRLFDHHHSDKTETVPDSVAQKKPHITRCPGPKRSTKVNLLREYTEHMQENIKWTTYSKCCRDEKLISKKECNQIILLVWNITQQLLFFWVSIWEGWAHIKKSRKIIRLVWVENLKCVQFLPWMFCLGILQNESICCWSS